MPTATKYPDLCARLAAPFSPEEIRFREVGGRPAPYVTARTVMNRLDRVLGVENWCDSYQPGQNSVLCTLTVRFPDGEYVAKSDAGGYAGMKDAGDDDMSGFSTAFKRAASRFGVGRYLYGDGVTSYDPDPEAEDAPVYPPLPTPPAGPTGGYRPPAEPHGGRHSPYPSPGPDAGWGPEDGPQDDRKEGRERKTDPVTGRALFARLKDLESGGAEGLVTHINNWGRAQRFAPRMIDWPAAQVVQAVAELHRQLQLRGIST